MNSIILILCEQANKRINKGVKNKVREIINQEDFKMVQQNINKFINK